MADDVTTGTREGIATTATVSREAGARSHPGLPASGRSASQGR
jgi:hypothetical protein